MTSLSVIIPTYNRIESLKKVLSGLEKQDVPGTFIEVIVVSDGSTDGTSEYLHTYQCPHTFLVMEQENQGAAAARNHGIGRATGDIVVFIDDDVVPAPELLREHLRCHRLYGPQTIVIGPLLTPKDVTLQPWAHWEQDKLYQQYADMLAGKWAPTPRQFYTGNASLARNHLVRSGGFDVTFRRAEDLELAYRLADLGLKFYFNPAAAAYHYVYRSFDSWLQIPYDYGRNDVVFSTQKGHPYLMGLFLKEFHTRHFLIKLVAWLCLDRRVLSKFLTAILKKMILAGDETITTLSGVACSILFNLNYYQGFCDGLGGRKIFFSQLIQLHKPHNPSPTHTNW